MSTTKPAYVYEKDTATVYKIRKLPYHTWADITLRQWPCGGALDIQSDYGTYAYSWCSTGERDFREFLIALNYDYFMGKVRQGQGAGQVFDCEGTVTAIKEAILERRKSLDISYGVARAAWYELKEIPHPRDINSFFLWLQDTNIADALCGDDIPTREMPDPQCKGFWDIVWPAACEIWEKELQSEGKRLCSGFRVYPGGVKCPGCADCQEQKEVTT